EDFRTKLVDSKEKRAGAELVQESTKKQKVEHDKEIAEIKKLIEIIPNEEELEIDVIPLAIKSPVFEQHIKDKVRRNQQDYKVLSLWSIFLEDATCAYLYVGREEVSPCTIYTFNDVGKEAYD
ncbi:hypothetical protein Tco_1572919, partial [Tanacetum coccineum]